MLSLGSIERDASLEGDIQRRLELHRRTNRKQAFQDYYLRRKLGWFLRDVIAPSPFYQDSPYQSILRSKRPTQRFSQLPLLDKSRVRQMAECFIAGKKPTAYFSAETSGTTGVPLQMWFDQEYFVSYYGRFSYFLEANGLWPAPFSMCMTTVSVFKNIVDHWILQPAINYSFYHRANIHLDYWESRAAVARSMAEEAPLILRGMPTSLELLASYMGEYPPPQPIRPQMLISISETLLATKRRELEAAFGAPVFDEYGLTEVGGIVAEECAEHQGFHINTVDFCVEVVDPSGIPVEDGSEGEIVITNLYSQTVPLLRYRTGDYAILTREPCRCGSVAPRISRLTGRALTRFTCPGRPSYNPFDAFGKFLLQLPVTQFQMVQRGDDQITLYYTGEVDVTDLEAARALCNAVQQLYAGAVDFRILKVQQFNRDVKFQAFLHAEAEAPVQPAL